MRRLLALWISALLAPALLCGASAQAAIVTVGSPLTGSFAPIDVATNFTLFNSALPEPGANVTSPVSGTIIRWRINGASGGPFKLRVLRPAGGTIYTGAGTSAAETPNSTGTLTFATSLPIQAGDAVGLDVPTSGTPTIGVSTPAGATVAGWQPPLADGESRAIDATDDGEAGFNADVATVPSNAFSFGKVTRNTRRGTATLRVNVPGPGTLTLTGRGVKKQRPSAATASKTVAAAGTVKLAVKPKRRLKRKLNERGKAKVKLKVTYTPTGDLPGVPNTQIKRVKLIKRD